MRDKRDDLGTRGWEAYAVNYTHLGEVFYLKRLVTDNREVTP